MSSWGSSTPPNQQFSLDNKMMVAAIIVMFLVLVFIFSLHVYAKWFFRHSATRSRTTSLRRRRFDFAGHDPFIVTGSVGLDKAVLDSLPAFVYQAPPADEAVLECAVCLCEFEDKENGRLLPKCNHGFHKDCIDMWFFSHSTCPLCRTVVTADSFPAAQHEQAQASASSSPLSEVLDQLRSGMQTSEAANSTGSLLPTTEGYILSRDDVLFPSSWGIPYPLTSLFGSDDNQRSSLLSSQSPDRSYAGSVPQITIDVQRRADILNSSLTSPRCLSADEQACSSPGGQPLKSPTSLRNSIRRLLSRESRVFPSDREGGQFK